MLAHELKENKPESRSLTISHIKNALDLYDQNKSYYETFLGDQADIKNLRSIYKSILMDQKIILTESQLFKVIALLVKADAETNAAVQLALNYLKNSFENWDSLLKLIHLFEQVDLNPQNHIYDIVDEMKNLIAMFKELRKAQLDNKENIKACFLQADHAEALTYIIFSLRKAGLMNQPILNLLFHPEMNIRTMRENMKNIISSLRFLQTCNMASLQNIQTLFQCNDFDFINFGLHALHHTNLLNHENINLLLSHSEYAGAIGTALNLLQDSKLATQDNFNQLFANIANADKILSAIHTLKTSQLLNQQNLTSLFKHSAHTGTLSLCIHQLHLAGLANQENLARLFTHAAQSDQIYHVLYGLRANNIIKQECINSIFHYVNKNVSFFASHFDHLLLSLTVLKVAHLFTAENIDLIFKYPKNAIYFANLFTKLLSANLLTADNVQSLQRYAGRANDLQLLLTQTQQFNQQTFNLGIASLNSQLQRSKEAFLMGLHPNEMKDQEAKPSSSVWKFFGAVKSKLNHPIGDKQILREVFRFL